MKKFNFVVLAIICLFVLGTICFGPCTAQAENEGITIKQGGGFTWDDLEYKNFSAVTVLSTKAVESWPAWANALVDGWLIDVGGAYDDASTLKDGVVLIGRDFGVLGDYINFINIPPWLKEAEVSIEIAGLYVEKAFEDPNIKGFSGVTYLQGKLRF